MKARVLAYLAALTPRTVRLAMGGLLAFMLLEGWLLVVRQPLGEFMHLRNEHAALAQHASDPQRTAAEITSVEHEVAALAGQLAGAGSQLSPDRVIVGIVDRLAGIATRRHAALHGVRPAGIKRVLMFDEMAFDIQVGGAYRELLDWMQDVERELGPLVVTRFSIKRGATTDTLSMELRLAAYRLADVGGSGK